MLILVRHGQTAHNAAGRLLGRSNPPLTDLGRRQAEACGRLLASWRVGSERALLICSSPLRRSRDSARLIARQLGAADVVADERLIELDYGSLEGLLPHEVHEAQWDSWRSDPSWRPPGGEALCDVQERVASFCAEYAALARDGEVVAVSHVSPIKAAACWALGTGPLLTWRMTLGIAAVTRVVTEPVALLSFGETSHLASVT